VARRPGALTQADPNPPRLIPHPGCTFLGIYLYILIYLIFKAYITPTPHGSCLTTPAPVSILDHGGLPTVIERLSDNPKV